ncbi:MAG TPA: helicase HerA-like domain-containing protein, partial [Pirellulales bacterium]
ILSKLLASLDEPYDHPRVQLSSLVCLSNMVVESLGPDYAGIIDDLRRAHFPRDELAELVNRLSMDILECLEPREHDLLGPIRALVYLQRPDAAIRATAHSFLRCEDLSPFDRDTLGGIVPRTDDAHPLEMIAALGYLMWTIDRRPLVLFVDQLEEMYNLENAKELFRRAMGALNAVAEQVPSSIIAIACLEDFYEQLKGSLAKPLIDRIENDPDKMRLETRRSDEEIIDLVSTRLAVLYEEADFNADIDDPTFPISAADLRQCRNLRTRDVLDRCRLFQQEYRRRGVEGPPPAFPLDSSVEPPVPVNNGVGALEEHWQTFLAEGKWTVPTDDAELAAVLAQAIEYGGGELRQDPLVRATANGRYVELILVGGDAPQTDLLVAICNKRSQGGSLAKQVEELEQRAAGQGRFMVRSMEFPSDPKTKIAALLGDYLTRGGRRAVIEDAGWRTMLAFADFFRAQQSQAAFAEWRKTEKPLTRLRALREMLEVERPVSNQSYQPPTRSIQPNESKQDESKQEVQSQDVQSQDVQMQGEPMPTELVTEIGNGGEASSPSGLTLSLGAPAGLGQQLVTINRGDLTRHAAFLGGSGSGKTTLALNLIEQLVERGVPAVLIDRKGDLCGYADPAWWDAPGDDDAAAARKRRLKNRLAINLYTPGNSRGRPLRLSLVPAGISADQDFDQLATAAGTALADMIGFGHARYGSQRAILIQAVKQLALLRPDRESSIEDLVELIHSQDPALINAIGHLDSRLFRVIVQALETLRLTRGRQLFDVDAEQLDIDRLLTPYEGRTRLTIISTKFLGGTHDCQFWVAQFLNELRRWANGRPSPSLQAVLLFDEADIYLPAKSQPACKAPLEDMLKRARSAGIGLLLATQSPGDFDYKCRENIYTWFLGRIKENTAIGKLKPMLEAARAGAVERLPGQQPGEFLFVQDRQLIALKADRSLLSTVQLADDEILRLAQPGEA